MDSAVSVACAELARGSQQWAPAVSELCGPAGSSVQCSSISMEAWATPAIALHSPICPTPAAPVPTRCRAPGHRKGFSWTRCARCAVAAMHEKSTSCRPGQARLRLILLHSSLICSWCRPPIWVFQGAGCSASTALMWTHRRPDRRPLPVPPSHRCLPARHRCLPARHRPARRHPRRHQPLLPPMVAGQSPLRSPGCPGKGLSPP